MSGRISRVFSGKSLQGRGACEQLLEAKEAEILRLRSELESWLAQGQAPRSAVPSRLRSPVGLSAKQRQQQDSAKAAARVSRARSSQAAENLEQARERLHAATRSLEGMEAYRSELTEALGQESFRQAAALAALKEAEERDSQEQREVASHQKLVQEASEELAVLEELNHQEEQELGRTKTEIHEVMWKQEACRAVLRQQRWTCQQMLKEKKILEDELHALRPILREEQAEQSAAFQKFEEEVQTLESLGRKLPVETCEVLDARREEHESWKSELGQTEQELWVAHRQLREQHKKNMGTLASCRRQAHTDEAKARAEAAQSFAAGKKEIEEAQRRLNKMQQKNRHQQTRQTIHNAFKAPVFQQRNKQIVVRSHSETRTRPTFASSPRSALSVASQEKQLEQGAAQSSELKELAFLEDRIQRLCREDQWLTAECRSVEEELEAMAIFCTPATALELTKNG